MVDSPAQALTDSHILLSEINDQTLFAFDGSFGTAFEEFSRVRGRLFVSDFGILLLGGLLVGVSLAFLASYLAFHGRSQTKTANFLLLFFDIPRSEVKVIHKKATKFLGFCKVGSPELLSRGGGLRAHRPDVL